MYEEDLQPYEPSQPLPPVGTVTFVPNHFAKAILGFGVAFIGGIYGLLEMHRHGNDMLFEEMARLEKGKEET